jgi:hypothetical protein
VRAVRLIPAATVAAVALAVAGCGGGSGSGTPAASSAPGSPANPLHGVEQPTGVPSRAAAGADVAKSGAAGKDDKNAAPAEHAGARSPKATQTDSLGGRTNEGATAAPTGTPGVTPGYQKLVEQQTSNPQERFTPCSLVTRAQARAIVGAPVKTPLEASQGPTCLYRTTPGAGFITVAVQNVRYSTLVRQLRDRRPVKVGTRTAVCGSRGRPTVLVALSGDRTLNVAAPCAVARQFAAKAVQRLRG